MNPSKHAAVWIDHNEAHVFFVDPEHVRESIVHSPHPHQHLHHKANTIGSGKAQEDEHFYHAVAESLRDAHEILITGPGQAKLWLIKHLHSHDPEVFERVIAVETVDHPSNNQLVAHARHYFDVTDRRITF